MRNEVGNKLENIFAQAVALNQSGRMKSTVYVKDTNVFIFNADHTLLLRFPLPTNQKPFNRPISFNANDYDSTSLYEKDGQIVFVQTDGDLERHKSCSSPEATADEIETLFGKFVMKKTNVVTLGKNILSLLDESLSHIELSTRAGKLKLVQRDIYTGTIIEVQRTPPKGFDIAVDKIVDDFGPVGLRTDDFIALFTFNDVVEFWFDTGTDFMFTFGKTSNMLGIIACCLYDELSIITESKGKQK